MENLWNNYRKSERKTWEIVIIVRDWYLKPIRRVKITNPDAGLWKICLQRNFRK